MGESDARFAAAKLLDRRFFEHPHLRGKVNPAGDYEVHCDKSARSTSIYLAKRMKQTLSRSLSTSRRDIFMTNRSDAHEVYSS